MWKKLQASGLKAVDDEQSAPPQPPEPLNHLARQRRLTKSCHSPFFLSRIYFRHSIEIV